MAVTATQVRFEGGAGAWYSDFSTAGPLLAASRVPWYLAQAPAAPAKIAIAGSGWGHSIKALRDAGRDASGFDASSYASLKYVTLEAGQAGRNATASVLNATQMTNYRRNTAGLSGSTKIPLMVSEDMLPCLTDAEVTTALTRMRDNATKVIHVVTCAVASDADPLVVRAGDLDARVSEMLWLTHQAWYARIHRDLAANAPRELVLNAETGAVL